MHIVETKMTSKIRAHAIKTLTIYHYEIYHKNRKRMQLVGDAAHGCMRLMKNWVRCKDRMRFPITIGYPYIYNW
jgi:hypothetical protein